MQSAILNALAKAYEKSVVGKTGGSGSRGFRIDYEKLLRVADLDDGDERELAELDLSSVEQQSGGAIGIHRNSRSGIKESVKVSYPTGEKFLFSALGQPAPTELRMELAEFFTQAQRRDVPEKHESGWINWLQQLSEAALNGASVSPFTVKDSEHNQDLIKNITGILSWQGKSLIRYASTQLTGDSKLLEKQQKKLEASLRAITSSERSSLETFGISPPPRNVQLHGGVTLHLPSGSLNLSILQGPVTISSLDVQSAGCRCELDAPLLLTVENESVFLEITQRNPGILVVHTSYPGRAVLELLKKLPSHLPCYHFGDTDPAGFDILRDIRNRSGRHFQPFMMSYRPDEKSSTELTSVESKLLTALCASPNLADIAPMLNEMNQLQLKGVFEQEALDITEVIDQIKDLLTTC